jgi:alpha-beta hydrolase superfamily lysophospholipase
MLLERIRGERKSQSDRHKPIIFIAHSLGGILVKKVRVQSVSLYYIHSVPRTLYYSCGLESR